MQMTPDEAAINKDLTSLWFRKGEALGKWKLLGLHFPMLYVVMAAAPRPNAPDWFLFKLEVQGYPAIGPTGMLWHGGLDQPLATEQRPYGAAGTLVYFSDFGPCLYHPIDRAAFANGHWSGEYFDERWQPGDHVTRYLEVLHVILHDPEYVGARVPDGAIALPPPPLAQIAA